MDLNMLKQLTSLYAGARPQPPRYAEGSLGMVPVISNTLQTGPGTNAIEWAANQLQQENRNQAPSFFGPDSEAGAYSQGPQYVPPVKQPGMNPYFPRAYELNSPNALRNMLNGPPLGNGRPQGSTVGIRG